MLLRHAKAEPSGGMSDALRPLALQGRRQSGAVGSALAARGLVPERVLVSSAVRTRQTWDLVRAALGDVPAPDVDVLDEVYDAHPWDVVDLLRGIDERVATVLVVGHEPTMSGTAATLARDDAATAGDLATVRTGLPTAGFAALEVTAWPELAAGAARLLEVVRPPH